MDAEQQLLHERIAVYRLDGALFFGAAQRFLDELAAVDVIAAGYETAGVDVTNLAEFITFSVSQMAHLNGGGGCTARGGEAHDHAHDE